MSLKENKLTPESIAEALKNLLPSEKSMQLFYQRAEQGWYFDKVIEKAEEMGIVNEDEALDLIFLYTMNGYTTPKTKALLQPAIDAVNKELNLYPNSKPCLN